MEEFFHQPETEIILKLMASNGEDSRSQIPFFIEGVHFNLSFVYQWVYVWGLDFSRLSRFLEIPEDKLFETIKDFVSTVKEKIAPSAIETVISTPIAPQSNLDEQFNKTLDLVATFPFHTSIVPQPSSEGLGQWSESFLGG